MTTIEAAYAGLLIGLSAFIYYEICKTKLYIKEILKELHKKNVKKEKAEK